jgi:hypothetical protein
VVGDLTARRGLVLATEVETRVARIQGEVPLAETFGYSTDLRSMNSPATNASRPASSGKWWPSGRRRRWRAWYNCAVEELWSAAARRRFLWRPTLRRSKKSGVEPPHSKRGIAASSCCLRVGKMIVVIRSNGSPPNLNAEPCHASCQCC